MREILLSQTGKNRGKYVAIVDDEDYEVLSKYRWHCSLRGGGRHYAHRQEPHNGGQCTIKMHREIVGAKEGEFVDHINGNGLDNRRSNLRICSHAENMRNRKLNANNTSGRKGVSWRAVERMWRAKITVEGKSISLGYFKNLDEAADAYNKAAKKYFGKFARSV